jgi:polysaccharide biosynthesis protein PslH
MIKKPKIIFFAPILEYPPKGGPQLSVINAIKVLNKVSRLHIVTSVNKKSHDNIAKQFIKEHSAMCLHTPSSKFFTKKLLSLKHASKLKRLLNPLTGIIDSVYISKFAKNNGIKYFWIDRVIEHAFFVFISLRFLNKHHKIVGDTETVYSDFILRELPFIKNPLRYFYIFIRGHFAKMQESIMLKKADVVTAVSELDKKHYFELVNNKSKIMLFSNVVDINEYSQEVELGEGMQMPYLILMGSFGHQNSPMDRAAKWLVSDIMPLVWSKIPNINICIVGRNSELTQSSLASDRVRVLGNVPYIFPYLKNASISLVPLIYESGTRFKIIESGAASIPCISTSLGAEGLNIEDGKNIIIADSTIDFASAIVKVMNDPVLANKLASELHILIKDEYSLNKQTQEGEDIIRFF